MPADRGLVLLRSAGFDTFFVVGIPLIASAAGCLAAYDNDLFLPLLLADLWLLGYHHVVSTFTRLSFDLGSFREHRSLIVYLLPGVAIAVVLLAVYVGAWAVTTVYLYWQWWHYTRQSEGISKAYAAKSRDRDLGNPTIRRLAFYAVPVAAMLVMSHRSPEEFLFFPVRTLPVSGPVMAIAGVAAAGLFLLWLAEQYRAYRAGKLASTYVAYVLSHFAVYYVAYVQIQDFTYGWLTINVWHNLQYILFVWLYNNRRFSGTANPKQRFLSAISQNGRFVLYFVTCFAISTALYLLISLYLADAMGAALAMTATMGGLIIYQTLNFHHYVVDSLIWKLRKPKIQRTLGLN